MIPCFAPEKITRKHTKNTSFTIRMRLQQQFHHRRNASKHISPPRDCGVRVVIPVTSSSALQQKWATRAREVTKKKTTKRQAHYNAMHTFMISQWRTQNTTRPLTSARATRSNARALCRGTFAMELIKLAAVGKVWQTGELSFHAHSRSHRWLGKRARGSQKCTRPTAHHLSAGSQIQRSPWKTWNHPSDHKLNHQQPWPGCFRAKTSKECSSIGSSKKAERLQRPIKRGNNNSAHSNRAAGAKGRGLTERGHIN